VHRKSIGKDADAIERDALTGAQRVVHAGCILRFDADDTDRGVERLHVRRDARDQATATDRHEDRVRR